MNVYKIVLHIHRLRCVALCGAYQQNGGHLRQFAYAYQKFVTEISRSETSATIYNLCQCLLLSPVFVVNVCRQCLVFFSVRANKFD